MRRASQVDIQNNSGPFLPDPTTSEQQSWVCVMEALSSIRLTHLPAFLRKKAGTTHSSLKAALDSAASPGRPSIHRKSKHHRAQEQQNESHQNPFRSPCKRKLHHVKVPYPYLPLLLTEIREVVASVLLLLPSFMTKMCIKPH